MILKDLCETKETEDKTCLDVDLVKPNVNITMVRVFKFLLVKQDTMQTWGQSNLLNQRDPCTFRGAFHLSSSVASAPPSKDMFQHEARYE